MCIMGPDLQKAVQQLPQGCVTCARLLLRLCRWGCSAKGTHPLQTGRGTLLRWLEPLHIPANTRVVFADTFSGWVGACPTCTEQASEVVQARFQDTPLHLDGQTPVRATRGLRSFPVSLSRHLKYCTPTRNDILPGDHSQQGKLRKTNPTLKK